MGRTISSLSREVSADPKSELSPSENLFSTRLPELLWNQSSSSLSIPLPRWVTVVSKLSKKRKLSWVHSKRIVKSLSKAVFEIFHEIFSCLKMRGVLAGKQFFRTPLNQCLTGTLTVNPYENTKPKI